MATQEFDVGSSLLKTQLAYGYNKTEVDGVNLPTILDGLEDKLFDNVEQTRMTRSVPRHSGSLSLPRLLKILKLVWASITLAITC